MTDRDTIRELIRRQRRMRDVLTLHDFYTDRPTASRLALAHRLAKRELARADRLKAEMTTFLRRELRDLRRRVRGDA